MHIKGCHLVTYNRNNIQYCIKKISKKKPQKTNKLTSWKKPQPFMKIVYRGPRPIHSPSCCCLAHKLPGRASARPRGSALQRFAKVEKKCQGGELTTKHGGKRKKNMPFLACQILKCGMFLSSSFVSTSRNHKMYQNVARQRH